MFHCCEAYHTDCDRCPEKEQVRRELDEEQNGFLEWPHRKR